MKIYSICIRNFCLGIYFGSSRYYHVRGRDLSWTGSNRIISLCICWQHPYHVGSGTSPRLASLSVFVRNLSLHYRLLIQYMWTHWCILGFILLNWWYLLLLLWLWFILTGSATLIWWINKCRWWIMLLRIYEHQFISFYKPTHDLPFPSQPAIGNVCPRLDLVLIIECLASVCLSVTEGCTDSCCSGASLYIGACWV